MSDAITLYHNPLSRGRIAHWMLEEIGVPYTLKVLSFEKREHKSAEFLAVNPMGKVPALVHRGVVVTEAAAICAYLADAFPEAQLAPALDDPQRGTYWRWLFFAAACIEPALTDKSFPRAPGARPSMLGYGSYDDVVAAMELALTPGPYVLGESFSAADVYLGSQLSYGMRMQQLEPRPAFNAYVARLIERPAFKRMAAQNERLAAAASSASH